MKKRVLISLLLLASSVVVLGAGAPYEIKLDIQRQSKDQRFNVIIHENDKPCIRAFLYSNGAKFQPDNTYGGTYAYGTNYEDSTNLVSVTGVVNTTTNFIEFQFGATDAATNGIFFSQVLLTNAAGWKAVFSDGQTLIYKSPISGSPGPLTLGTPVNWDSISTYSGTFPMYMDFSEGTSNNIVRSNTSTGVVFSIEFGASGTPTLNQVLATGNDANNQNITNLGNVLIFNSSSTIRPSGVTEWLRFQGGTGNSVFDPTFILYGGGDLSKPGWGEYWISTNANASFTYLDGVSHNRWRLYNTGVIDGFGSTWSNFLIGAGVTWNGNDIEASYLTAGHTATNYTPVNVDVNGHFSGIDDALGGIDAALLTSVLDIYMLSNQNNIADQNHTKMMMSSPRKDNRSGWVQVSHWYAFQDTGKYLLTGAVWLAGVDDTKCVLPSIWASEGGGGPTNRVTQAFVCSPGASSQMDMPTGTAFLEVTNIVTAVAWLSVWHNNGDGVPDVVGDTAPRTRLVIVRVGDID